MLRLGLAALALAWSASVAAADNYDVLLARAKAGEAVDFAALRYAYAETPAYQPYGGPLDDAEKAMRDAFNAHDCAKVLPAAQQILDADFVDIEAHLLAARCFEDAAAADRAKFHRAVAKGLMDSIVASGDGKSPKTAFVVIAVDEEYAVLAALRWRVGSQSLVEEDGHGYDRMEVKSATSEETAVLFFQIDRPMKWLSGRLGKE